MRQQRLITEFTLSDTATLGGPDPIQPWSRTTVRVVIVHQDHLVFSYMANRNQYVLPGGGIEPGESLQVCAQRECREELGMIITADAPSAVVREYYDGILRYQNWYVLGTFTGERTDKAVTAEEQSLGLREAWIPLQEVEKTLMGTRAHLMKDEYQVPHVQRAIANCHRRELLGIAACLGWDYEHLLTERSAGDHLTIRALKVKTDT